MKKLLVLSAALLMMVMSFAQGPHGHGDGKHIKGKKQQAAYDAGFREGYNRAQYQMAYNHGQRHEGYQRGKHKGKKQCHGNCQGKGHR